MGYSLLKSSPFLSVKMARDLSNLAANTEEKRIAIANTLQQEPPSPIKYEIASDTAALIFSLPDLSAGKTYGKPDDPRYPKMVGSTSCKRCIAIIKQWQEHRANADFTERIRITKLVRDRDYDADKWWDDMSDYFRHLSAYHRDEENRKNGSCCGQTGCWTEPKSK